MIFSRFQPTDADRCFEEHPKTDISLQLAIYYYALQIYSSVKPCSRPDIYSLYTHPPIKVMQKVVSLVTQKTDIDWPEEVKELVLKIKQYNEMLEDYRQAIVLKKLGRGKEEFWILNMNGYTFRGSNSVIFIVASHINWGHLLKERICSHWSKFFPLRVDPILERLHPACKQTGSLKNCLPLKTCRKKMEVYPYTLM